VVAVLLCDIHGGRALGLSGQTATKSQQYKINLEV
jgi:hypothetical protein